jgi:hypothetical protein
MTFLKLYGLRRSGTNYARWLIENNFDDLFLLVNHLGWKHGKVIEEFDLSGLKWGIPEVDETNYETHKNISLWRKELEPIQQELEEAFLNNQIKYCFCIKNPFHYIASILKYKGEVSIEKWVKRWNKINNNYINFCEKNPDNCYIIRYEDYIHSGFYVVLREMMNRFDLSPKHKSLGSQDLVEFINQEKVVSRGSKTKEKKFDLESIKRKDYLRILKKDEITLIKELSDQNIIKKLTGQF